MKYFAYCRKSSEEKERQALSIPAQIDEIRRVFDHLPDLEIVDWIEEEMSAKAPGRPLYGEMIKRIERGEADGIVAWHPDRLARNSVDGGWIIHLLDRRILKDLKFVSYTYEHSAQGMFMLQIMFGQSKYYVDNLSVNVKRGMRKKVEMGWLPNLAPLGYKNDRETSTIVSDPERFPILRQMWDLLLTGAYSVRQINARANDEWGFRTPVRKRSGGRPMSLAATYKMFGNPFYAGVLDWYDRWRPGKHQAMVTLEEFNRAQAILGRPGRPKPETHAFAYTGLIRCECGLSVTAEKKTKPSGREYVYYHCTRRAQPRCNQPAVRLEDVEHYIRTFLRQIYLPACVEQQLRKHLEQSDSERRLSREKEMTSVTNALRQARQELRTLTDLRVRNLLDDSEYIERRKELQKEEARMQEATRNHAAGAPLWLELAQCTILLRKYAADWFFAGNIEDKRLILQTVGWNSTLADERLSIQARSPFKRLEKPADCLYWRAIVEALGTHPEGETEVRTLIESIKCLKARADARQSQSPVPGIPASIPMRRGAVQGRAAWRPPELRDQAA